MQRAGHCVRLFSKRLISSGKSTVSSGYDLSVGGSFVAITRFKFQDLLRINSWINVNNTMAIIDN
jgi:hypothetical protein